MARKRWTNRPDGSNWGDFGPDDQVGRLNLLTPDVVRKGAAEVREGLTFCLSLPLDYPGGNILNPRRHPPHIRPTRRGDRINFNFSIADEEPGRTDVVCDDAVLLHLQYSTQWDSLAHVGGLFDADGDGQPEKVFYNGYRAHVHVLGPEDGVQSDAGEPASAAQALGIENMAATGVQGRGVMVDLHARFGTERRFVGHADLVGILEADDIVVEPGDMLCLHTGFAQMILDMGRQPDADRLHTVCSVLDGRDQDLLDWISDSGISALIADNYAVEAYPAREMAGDCAALPLHEHCLFKLGLPLGELWHLTPLAEWLHANGRSYFQLTAPPLRLPGAVGSPVSPVATV